MKRKPGRKSATELAAARPGVAVARRIEPPLDLSDAARELWLEIVATKPADYFDAGSAPLLATYCTLALQARQQAELLANTDPIADEAVHGRRARLLNGTAAALANLGVRLRLAQSAVYRADSAKLRDKPPSGRPWERA